MTQPRTPITIYLLPPVIVIALIALGMAAYHAFSQVTGPTQAIFSALVIEISAVVEAIALIRGRNWIALGGMIVSLAVSGTYNYIQAATAGAANGLTNSWQLITLAIGPLSALLFLSMTLGRELRTHEQALATWQAGRQSAAETARKDAESLELEKERIRIETESRMELAKFRAQLRAESRKDTAPTAETFRKVSDWRSLPLEDKKIIAGMDTAQIMQAYNVSDRTARNWRAKASANGFH